MFDERRVRGDVLSRADDPDLPGGSRGSPH